MAGGGDAADNPVAINVVPMVDVIFCLCVFFMCSMKFKQLEGKFEAWLPKDAGTAQTIQLPKEIRIAIYWDAQHAVARLQMGTRLVEDGAALRTLLRGARDDFAEGGGESVPVVIDADGRVPWKDVIGVIDACRELHLDRIEFALGKPN
jgi:biopolymer transport protein ExbD